MDKFTKYKTGNFTHPELITKIMEKPETLHPNFQPLKKEMIILRGQLDILGMINEKYCIVEVKIDKHGGLKSHAKRQLWRYADAINEQLGWFDYKPIKFCFIIVRNHSGNLYVDFYESGRELMQKEKYVNGIGWVNGSVKDAKQKHLKLSHKRS